MLPCALYRVIAFLYRRRQRAGARAWFGANLPQSRCGAAVGMLLRSPSSCLVLVIKFNAAEGASGYKTSLYSDSGINFFLGGGGKWGIL